MSEAINSQSVSIASLNLISSDTAKAILTLVIADLIEFLNVGMTMSVNQIQMTVEMILRDPLTKNLKPEDFKVCFEQFKKSGKVWNRVDGQTIFEMIYKYAEERLEYVEMLSINQHTGKKLAKTILHPDIIEMYKEADRLRKEQKLTPNPLVAVDVKVVDTEIDGKKFKYVAKFVEPEKVEKKPKKIIEKSPRDIYIQKCLTEFDDIAQVRYENGMAVPGKYVKINGEYLDVVEYTEYKLTEYDLNN